MQSDETRRRRTGEMQRAFGDLPGAAMAMMAVLLYRAEPGLFERVLARMEEDGVPVCLLQQRADQLAAMLREYLKKGDAA